MNFFLDFVQLTVNGAFRGVAYGALGAGFALILGVTGRFHFAYAFTYTATVYVAFDVGQRFGLPFWPAAVVGVVASALLSVLIERFVYRPVARRAGTSSTMAIFVASLGVGIAGIAVVQLVWGTQSLPFYGPPMHRVELGGVAFLSLDLYQAASSLLMVFALAAVLKFTPLGRLIKATRGNPDLSRVMGINTDRVFLAVFAIAGVIAAVEAVWSGLQFTADSAMGDRSVIYAFVVAFLGGTNRSPLRVLVAGIALGLCEQWASTWLSAQWTQNTVFAILVIYLIILSTSGRWTQFWLWFSRAKKPAV